MSKSERTLAFRLPAPLEAALQGAQGALGARDAERAAVERAAIAVTDAKRALAAAVQAEEGAEVAMAHGAPGAVDLKRTANAAWTARESAELEVERAERRAKILADAFDADEGPINAASAQLDAALDELWLEVEADYRARLTEAIDNLVPLVAEGQMLRRVFRRGNVLGAVLNRVTLPNPRAGIEAFYHNHGSSLMVSEGSVRAEGLPAAAPANQLASALEGVCEVFDRLQTVIQGRSRRAQAERERLSSAEPQPGVRIFYSNGEQMVHDGALWQR